MQKGQKIEELKKMGAQLPPRVVQRKLKAQIIPWMERDEIIVITGARQTGKSVLLYQLIYDYALKKTNNIYYFNLDLFQNRIFVREPERLTEIISNSKSKTYIFIDEIQRLKEPGLFLKGIYDLHLPVKIVVSGSSALEIKSKIHEPLTGRKILFQINPFNLEELAQALFPETTFHKILEDKNKFKKTLEHYLTYGGYPAVALAKTKAMKLRLLDEIFKSYLDKDVKSLLNVENETAFRNLIKILSSQIGNLMNKDELANSLGIHKNTLENYLFYLEQTFIMELVHPFFKNRKKELLKSPKVYFYDPGLRNYAISGFSDFNFRPDKGALFENYIFLWLKGKKQLSEPVYFWRTKTGAEVDFVQLQGLEPIPYEVKAIELKDYKVTKSLHSFIQTYHPRKAYCVNLSFQGKNQINGTEMIFLTPQDLYKSFSVKFT